MRRAREALNAIGSDSIFRRGVLVERLKGEERRVCGAFTRYRIRRLAAAEVLLVVAHGHQGAGRVAARGSYHACVVGRLAEHGGGRRERIHLLKHCEVLFF